MAYIKSDNAQAIDTDQFHSESEKGREKVCIEMSTHEMQWPLIELRFLTNVLFARAAANRRQIG